jgi:hypothetical protein
LIPHSELRIPHWIAMIPLPATQALDAYFLEARARLLDLAAILDRISRGSDAAAALADPRSEKLRRALGILLTRTDGRAEAVQQLFSLDYDPTWKRPAPR